MHGSLVSRRVRLLTAPLFVLVAAGIGTALYRVLPTAAEVGESEDQQPSEMSIAWLRTMLKANPGDEALRLKLARQLVASGRLDDAEDVIGPLMEGTTEGSSKARRMAVSIRLDQLRQLATDSAEREQQGNELSELMLKCARESTDPEVVEGLIHTAVEIGRPALAASICERMAAVDAERRVRWTAERARMLRAAGDNRGAALAFESAAGLVEGDDGYGLAESALDAALASGNTEEAFAIAERLLRRFGGNKAMLDRGKRVALMASHPVAARDIGRRRLALTPSDPDELLSQVDLELGAGDPAAALLLVERAIALSPSGAALHRKAIQAALWAGRHDRVFAHRLWLARNTRDAVEIERIMSAARGQYQLEIVREMILLRTQTEGMSEPTLLELAKIEEALGDPEEALRVLHAGAPETSRSRRVWERIAELELARGDTRRGLDAWYQIENRFGLTTAEAMRVGTLHWRLGRSGEALAALRRGPEPGDADVKYWQLRESLAWEEGHKEDALRALRMLWKGGARDARIASRLIELTDDSGTEGPSLESIARESWERWSDPSHLIAAANRKSEQGDPRSALRILDMGMNGVPQGGPAEGGYLLRRGELLASLGRTAEAKQMYTRALRTAQDSVPAAADLLWLSLDQGDESALAEQLAGLRTLAAQSPPLWAPMAAGLSRLGRHEQALPWFALQARESRGDSSMLSSYADALARAGRMDAALRIRRQLLATIEPAARVELVKYQGRDRQTLRLRSSLARALQGPSAGYTWMRYRLQDPGDRSADDEVLSWYLTDANVTWGEEKALRKRLEQLSPDARHRVALGIVTEAGDGLGPMLARLEREEQEPSAVSLRYTPSADRPSGLAPDREPEERRAAPTVRAGATLQQMNKLTAAGPEAATSVPISNSVAIQAEVQAVRIVDRSDAWLDPGTQDELNAMVGPAMRHGKGRTTITGGASIREESTVGRAEVSHTSVLSRALILDVSGAYNRIPSDSPLLRAAGVRDDVGAALTLKLSEREYLAAAAGGFLEMTRQMDWLASGLRASAEAGHRLVLAEPEVRLFASGAWAGRRVTNGIPGDLPTTQPIDSYLPRQFAAAGAGVQVLRGDLLASSTNGRVHGLLEVWGGWIHPASELGFRARAGVGVPLFGKDQLSLMGHYASGVGGVAGMALGAVSLTYSRTLE